MNVETLRIKIEEAIYAWAAETNSIEANSRFPAGSEQSVVGRPVEVESENPALARPVTLPELKAYLESRFESPDVYLLAEEWSGWLMARMSIGKWIDELDQGPVASTPLEEIVSRVNSDSYKSQDIDV